MKKSLTNSKPRIAKKTKQVKGITQESGTIIGTEEYNKFVTGEGKKATEKNSAEGRTRTGPQKNFTRIPNSVIQNSNLSHGELHLYAVLLSHEFGTGKTQMGQRLIVKEAKIGKENIKKRLKSLKKQGYIKMEKGDKQRTIYTFPKFK